MNIEKELFTKEEVLYEKIRMINRILDNPNTINEIVKELMDEILYHKENKIKTLEQQYIKEAKELLFEQEALVQTVSEKGNLI